MQKSLFMLQYVRALVYILRRTFTKGEMTGKRFRRDQIDMPLEMNLFDAVGD